MQALKGDHSINKEPTQIMSISSITTTITIMINCHCLTCPLSPLHLWKIPSGHHTMQRLVFQHYPIDCTKSTWLWQLLRLSKMSCMNILHLANMLLKPYLLINYSQHYFIMAYVLKPKTTKRNVQNKQNNCNKQNEMNKTTGTSKMNRVKHPERLGEACKKMHLNVTCGDLKIFNM